MPVGHESQTGETTDQMFRGSVEVLTEEVENEEYARYGAYVGTYPTENALPVPPGTSIEKVSLSVERVWDVPIVTANATADSELVDVNAAEEVEEIDTGARLWTIAWKDAEDIPILCITRISRDTYTFRDSEDVERTVRSHDVSGGIKAILSELMGLVNTGNLAPVSEEQLQAEMTDFSGADVPIDVFLD